MKLTLTVEVGAGVLEEDGAVDLRGRHGRGRRKRRGGRRMAARADGHGGRAGGGGRRRVLAAWRVILRGLRKMIKLKALRYI